MKTLKEWNKEYDCAVLTLPKDFIAKRAFIIELKINFGIKVENDLLFVVDLNKKNNLKKEIFKLAKKYKQNVLAFFSKDSLNLLEKYYDYKFEVSHGFNSMTNAMLVGKIIKEYKD